jgi:hypothetical protein
LKPISHGLTRILKNFRNFPNTDTDYGDLNIANSTIRLNFAEQLYEPSPSKKKNSKKELAKKKLANAPLCRATI